MVTNPSSASFGACAGLRSAAICPGKTTNSEKPKRVAVERPKERRAFLRFLKRLFRPGRNKLGVLYAMHADRGFSFYRLSAIRSCLHGDSHEKWINETRLDISAGSRAEDDGPQENPRRPNCQEVETDRRRHAPKSVQYGIVTRLALTTRSLRIFLQRSPALRGAFFSIVVCTPAYGAHPARQLASFRPVFAFVGLCAYNF